MNTRTKLAIAVSAALWMIPMTRRLPESMFEAGDWKIDFSGNVNAFYTWVQLRHTERDHGGDGRPRLHRRQLRRRFATVCCRRRWCSAPPRGKTTSIST